MLSTLNYLQPVHGFVAYRRVNPAEKYRGPPSQRHPGLLRTIQVRQVPKGDEGEDQHGTEQAAPNPRVPLEALLVPGALENKKLLQVSERLANE